MAEPSPGSLLSTFLTLRGRPPYYGGVSDSPTTHEAAADLRAEVERIINLMRPAVQADGGDLELVEVTADGDVTVRFHGACVGCPSSGLTLQAGIERNLRQHVDGIRTVSAVE